MTDTPQSNLIEIFNSFWQRFSAGETGLKIGEAGLFNYLVSVWNAKMRPERVELPQTEIIEATGLHERTLKKYLSALQQLGFIEFQPGKWRLKPASFSILLKGSKNAGLATTQRVAKMQGFSQLKGSKNAGINEQRLYPEKKSPKSEIWDALLTLSLNFHQRQKTDGLNHQEFKHNLTTRSKIVTEGADELDKLHRLDGEALADIRRTLEFILKDTGNGNGWTGWKHQILSLKNIRTKGKTGAYKYFNAKNALTKKTPAPPPEPKLTEWN